MDNFVSVLIHFTWSSTMSSRIYKDSAAATKTNGAEPCSGRTETIFMVNTIALTFGILMRHQNTVLFTSNGSCAEWPDDKMARKLFLAPSTICLINLFESSLWENPHSTLETHKA